MICPECNGKTTVFDIVHLPSGEIYRQRKCKKCNKKFFTAEFIIEYDVHVKKEWNKYHRGYSR